MPNTERCGSSLTTLKRVPLKNIQSVIPGTTSLSSPEKRLPIPGEEPDRGRYFLVNSSAQPSSQMSIWGRSILSFSLDGRMCGGAAITSWLNWLQRTESCLRPHRTTSEMYFEDVAKTSRKDLGCPESVLTFTALFLQGGCQQAIATQHWIESSRTNAAGSYVRQCSTLE